MKRKTNHKPNIAPTMQSAAGRLNLSLDVLKAAKDAGCDAFRERGSVDCDRLPKWLAEHPDILSGEPGGMPSKAIEQALLLRARRQREEHRLAVERREYVLAAEVRRGIGRMVISAKQQFLTNVDSIVAGAAMKCNLTPDQCNALREIVSSHTHATLKELAKGQWAEEEQKA